MPGDVTPTRGVLKRSISSGYLTTETPHHVAGEDGVCEPTVVRIDPHLTSTTLGLSSTSLGQPSTETRLRGLDDNTSGALSTTSIRRRRSTFSDRAKELFHTYCPEDGPKTEMGRPLALWWQAFLMLLIDLTITPCLIFGILEYDRCPEIPRLSTYCLVVSAIGIPNGVLKFLYRIPMDPRRVPNHWAKPITDILFASQFGCAVWGGSLVWPKAKKWDLGRNPRFECTKDLYISGLLSSSIMSSVLGLAVLLGPPLGFYIWRIMKAKEAEKARSGEGDTETTQTAAPRTPHVVELTQIQREGSDPLPAPPAPPAPDPEDKQDRSRSPSLEDLCSFRRGGRRGKGC